MKITELWGKNDKMCKTETGPAGCLVETLDVLYECQNKMYK